MTNKKPFEGINNINKIMIEVVNKNSRPKINGSIPLCYRNLINSCWQKDKNKRPTFDQIVNILKTDPNFITNDVSKSEYLNYVSSIDQQENHIKVDANDDFFDLSFTNKLDIHQIEKLEKIGVGNFFTIFKVLENKRFVLIAAKVINLETNKISKKEIQNQLKKRFLKSSALTFPSILEIHGYSPFDFEFKFNPTIFIELADMTLKEVVDLERIGKAPNKWNLTTKLIVIYGIAAGMNFLHSKNIVHRNINMNSILLNNLFHPKIYDFKLSKFVSEITGKIVNFDELNEDSMYIAHEIWYENKEYKSSDVYAFSLIVYEILTKERPTNMPHINVNVPKCFQDLILNCYNEDPNKRFTFDQIVNILRKDISFNDEVDLTEYFMYVKHIDKFLNPEEIEQSTQNSQPKQNNQSMQTSQNISSYLTIDSKFIIDINDYKRIEEISNGSFTKVFSAQNIKTKELVAAKIFNKLSDDITDKKNYLFF